MEQRLLFQKYYKGKHWGKHPITYSKQFSEFLKKHKFKGLLVDIGCGEGRDVDVFSKSGFKVIGIDNDRKEIEMAKTNYPDYKFELQDAEKLKFKDKSVSAFFCINVIHYTEIKKTMKEIYRALKEKGYLFIHFNALIIDNKGDVDYEHQEKEILELISNFKIVQKRIFERFDSGPIKHKHKVMELILQK